MMQDKINDRKQYLEQIRQSFHDANTEEAYNQTLASAETMQDERNAPRGYFKFRLVCSVILFLAFVFIWKTDWSYDDINAVSIQQKIQTNFKIPDSVPQIPEILSLLEQ